MADDKKVLNDILQGLVTTDRKVIEKINTDVSELEEKVARGSGSYGLVDLNTPGAITNGSLIDDMGASHGKSYSVTSATDSNKALYSGNFSDVKFGKYAMCLRMKTNSTTASNILQVMVLNGTQLITSQDITGAQFGTADQYQYIYTTFNYEGDGKTKEPLKIHIVTHAIDGVTVNFDYAYISMIIPSVFL